jgi:hypothetical protein
MLAGRIFAREKHRDPEFDLTKRYPEPSFFLINELLDSLIAADLSRRYEFAQEVAHAVRQLIKRIEARGHAMDPGAPQPGIYCAQGLYQPIVDCVNRDPRREYHEERQIMQTFGFLESHSASRISWLIFICDTCGNVQLFRPDFVRNQSAWKSR